MRNKNSKSFFFLIYFMSLSSCGLAQIEIIDTSYIVNIGKNNMEYYHLQYELTPQNMIHVDELSKAEFFQNGGQFEVTVQKRAFPIEAPKCNSNIIIRMPWVPSEDALSKKYSFFEEISSVFRKKEGVVLVSIELNPYIEKTSEGVMLTNCNVFFRHANDEYIPHTESL